MGDIVGTGSLPGQGISCPREIEREKHPPITCDASKSMSYGGSISHAYLANYWIVVFTGINIHRARVVKIVAEYIQFFIGMLFIFCLIGSVLKNGRKTRSSCSKST